MDKNEYFKLNFGRRLKQVLEVKGVSQTDLAKQINVDKTVISKYINDSSRVPRVDTLLAICNALDISTDYFLDEKVAKKELNIIPTEGYDIFLSIATLVKIGFITYDNKKKRYNLNFDDMSFKEFIDEMLNINKLQYLKNIDELMNNIVIIYGNNYDKENNS